MTVKQCYRCRSEKPITEFGKDKSKKDGCRPYCKDCGNKISRESYKRHPKKFSGAFKKWKQNNPTGHFLSMLKHRFKKLGHLFSKEDILDIVTTNSNCPYCKVEFILGDKSNISIDHKIPKASGGTNDFDNLHLVCKSCNMMKGIFTDNEFKRLVEFLEQNQDLWKRMRSRLVASGFMYRNGR